MSDDLTKTIIELRNVDKPSEAKITTTIDGVEYDARISTRFWHNPFTGNRGHRISIDLKTVKE